MATSNKFDSVNKQLDYHLKNNVWADSYHTFSRSYSHGIKRILQRWDKSQSDLATTVSKINYTDLKNASRHQQLLQYHDTQIPSFTSIPSTPNHHQVIDHHNNILAYRFSLPEHLVTSLTKSYSLLPDKQYSSSVRGTYSNDHYALWADYSPNIFYSSEYTRDLPHAQTFLDANKPLFTYLSNNLRLISPPMYLKLTSLDSYLPPHLHRLAGAWAGLAVNRGHSIHTNSSTHYDWKDYPAAYNCVVPTSHDPDIPYTGAHLVLWPLSITMELKPGDALFFFGSL